MIVCFYGIREDFVVRELARKLLGWGWCATLIRLCDVLGEPVYTVLVLHERSAG